MRFVKFICVGLGVIYLAGLVSMVAWLGVADGAASEGLVQGATSECRGVPRMPPSAPPAYRVSLRRGERIVRESSVLRGPGHYSFLVKPGVYVLSSSASPGDDYRVTLHPGEVLTHNLFAQICPL